MIRDVNPDLASADAEGGEDEIPASAGLSGGVCAGRVGWAAEEDTEVSPAPVAREPAATPLDSSRSSTRFDIASTDDAIWIWLCAIVRRADLISFKSDSMITES